MKAYKYDSITKRYIGEVNCQLDPIATYRTGEDVYLLPANATYEIPLEEKDGFYVVWNGYAWEYQEIPQPEPEPEPEPHIPTKEEQRIEREIAYQNEVDPITAHIQRLRDKEQTEDVIAEINALLVERDEKVEEIKARYPYPTDPITEEGE